MSLVGIVVILLLVGFAMYALRHWVPWIDADFKRIIYVVVVIAVVLWLISIFFGPFPDIFVGRRY